MNSCCFAHLNHILVGFRVKSWMLKSIWIFRNSYKQKIFVNLAKLKVSYEWRYDPFSSPLPLGLDPFPKATQVDVSCPPPDAAMDVRSFAGEPAATRLKFSTPWRKLSHLLNPVQTDFEKLRWLWLANVWLFGVRLFLRNVHIERRNSVLNRSWENGDIEGLSYWFSRFQWLLRYGSFEGDEMLSIGNSSCV